MVRQQLQGSLGVFALKVVDTYGADRKPNAARKHAIFFPSLYPVNPVGSDRVALN